MDFEKCSDGYSRQVRLISKRCCVSCTEVNDRAPDRVTCTSCALAAKNKRLTRLGLPAVESLEDGRKRGGARPRPAVVRPLRVQPPPAAVHQPAGALPNGIDWRLPVTIVRVSPGLKILFSKTRDRAEAARLWLRAKYDLGLTGGPVRIRLCQLDRTLADLPAPGAFAS